MLRRRRHVVEPGAGALQRALDGGCRGVEHLGHIGGRKGEHLPQEHHRPLPGRQELEAGDQREALLHLPRRTQRVELSAGLLGAGSTA